MTPLEEETERIARIRVAGEPEAERNIRIQDSQDGYEAARLRGTGHQWHSISCVCDVCRYVDEYSGARCMTVHFGSDQPRTSVTWPHP
jgi:hypothetical protein